MFSTLLLLLSLFSLFTLRLVIASSGTEFTNEREFMAVFATAYSRNFSSLADGPHQHLDYTSHGVPLYISTSPSNSLYTTNVIDHNNVKVLSGVANQPITFHFPELHIMGAGGYFFTLFPHYKEFTNAQIHITYSDGHKMIIPAGPKYGNFFGYISDTYLTSMTIEAPTMGTWIGVGAVQFGVIPIECSGNCASCSLYACTECNPNYYLYNGVCVSECPKGTHQTATTCEEKDCVPTR